MPDPKQEFDIVDEYTGKHVGKSTAGDVASLPVGLRVANTEEQRRILLEKKFSSLPAKASVAAYSLFEEAVPLGLGGAILETVSPGIGQYYREGQEVSPVAATIGRAGGIASNVALLGGPSMALEGALARGGVGALARGAGLGAVEGALTGGGYAFSEGMIDNDVSGERIAAGVLFGAGVGGVLGGGIGGLASMVGRGRNALAQAADAPGEEAVTSALTKEFGHAPKSLVKTLMGGAAEVSAVISGKPRDIVKKAFTEPRWRKLVREFDGRRDGIVDDIARQLDEIEEADEVVADVVQSASQKRTKIEHLVRKDNVGEQVAALSAEVDNLRGAMKEASDRHGSWNGFTDIERTAQGLLKDLDDAAASGAKNISSRINSAMDQLKREVGTYSKSARKARGKPGKGAMWSARHEVLKDSYDRFRSRLEDADLFGEAATFQRELNEQLTPFMAARGKYHETFLTDGINPSKIDPWVNSKVADRKKVERYVDGLLDPNQDLAHQTLTTSLDRKARAAKVLLDGAELEPAQARAAQRLINGAKNMRGYVDDATELITAGNQAKVLDKGDGRGGLLGSALLGGVLGGPGGSIAAMVLSSLQNPATLSRQMGAVEAIVGRQKKPVTQALDKVAKSGKPVVGVLGPTRAIRGSIEAGRHQVDRYQDAVRRYRMDEDLNRYRLDKSVELVRQAAPRAATAAVETYARAIDYVEKHLPAGQMSMAIFGSERRASRGEVSAFLRRMRAVEDPTSVAKDFADGKLSVEAVDAFKTVYPGTYSEVRSELLTSLAEMNAKGERLPWRQRLQANILLELPVDPTMEPEFIQRVQESYKKFNDKMKQETKARQHGRAGDAARSEDFMTGSQKTEAGL